MKVYTVLAMDDVSKKVSLEPYSALELALVRAAWITRQIYGLIPNENPEALKTGLSNDVEYIVLQDNESIIISVLEQDIRESLPYSCKDFFTAGGDLGGTYPEAKVINIVPPPPPVDNAMDNALPAGWQHDGTPIRMDTLLDDADSVKCVDDLTTDQQFALAIARISKRPNFSYPTDIGVLVQSSALSELRRRTSYGCHIMEFEMEFLDNVRNTNLIMDIDD
jgi:hypothetical protein